MHRFVFVCLGLAACSSSPSTSSSDGSTSHTDASVKADLAGHDLASTDLASVIPQDDAGSSLDGTPTRQQCTSKYGTSLNTDHGRLDGILMTVLAPGQGQQCNGDDAHVHLQVSMNGGIYDVAVDIGQSGDQVAVYETDMALPDGAWAEGWHTSDSLSYKSLGISSSQFTLLSPSDAASTVENALANANHVSIFGTGYNSNGMHLVHYESGKDGAIAIDPLSPMAHLLLFKFQADSF